MESFLADLMAEQARQGLRSVALVHRSDLGLGDQSEIVEHCDQKVRVYRSAVWLRAFFAPIAPTFIFSAWRCIRKEKPDLLHLHMPNLSVFWLLLLPSARQIPWVVHWHSDVVASSHSRALRILYPFYRPFEQLLLRHAAAIIATSPPYLKSSIPLARHREKCHIIPLGLNPIRIFRALHEEERSLKMINERKPPETANANKHPSSALPGDVETCETMPLNIVSVGRLTYYKGFNVLLAAVAKRPQFFLTLIGDGEEGPQLERQVADNQLHTRVTLAGAVDEQELAIAIRDADVLCLPSLERTEAFGMVLLEAMALGTAVIASDIQGSGTGWVVASPDAGARAGELVTPGDIDGLATALSKLRTDRKRLEQLGSRGQHRFIEYFHINRCAESVNSLYCQILKA
jgi:rhamnosyl/mannosyltransferase